MKEKTVKLH